MGPSERILSDTKRHPLKKINLFRKAAIECFHVPNADASVACMLQMPKQMRGSLTHMFHNVSVIDLIRKIMLGMSRWLVMTKAGTK